MAEQSRLPLWLGRARRADLMILSELRASAWKYASGVLAVLAVAAILYCLFLRAHSAADRLRADAAESRAKQAQGELAAVRQAQVRDALSETATQVAIGRMDDAATETNERLARLEGRINGRPPVAAVCPDPDPDLVRESRAGADRFRATGSELRRLRTAQGSTAR